MSQKTKTGHLDFAISLLRNLIDYNEWFLEKGEDIPAAYLRVPLLSILEAVEAGKKEAGS